MKSWKGESGYDKGPLSQWEILNYCRLKAVQGSLIPKLLFVSRMRDGTRAIGLELGKPIHICYRCEMQEINHELSEHGWMQRDGSLRSDNFVRIEGRLVAIDLESFIPAFYYVDINHMPPPTISYGSVLGIPIVEPTEVQIEGCRKYQYVVNARVIALHSQQHTYSHSPILTRPHIFLREWTTNNVDTIGHWGATEVSLHSYSYDHDAESLRLLLERNFRLKTVQGSLIITPLFLTRERNGTIIVGYKRFSEIFSEEQKETMNGVYEDLNMLGWTVPEEEKDMVNFCNLDDKILFHNLSCLLPNEGPPDVECVSSEETSASSQEHAHGAGEAIHSLSPNTLRPLPHRTNQASSPDSQGKM